MTAQRRDDRPWVVREQLNMVRQPRARLSHRKQVVISCLDIDFGFAPALGSHDFKIHVGMSTNQRALTLAQRWGQARVRNAQHSHALARTALLIDVGHTRISIEEFAGDAFLSRASLNRCHLDLVSP